MYQLLLKLFCCTFILQEITAPVLNFAQTFVETVLLQHYVARDHSSCSIQCTNFCWNFSGPNLRPSKLKHTVQPFTAHIKCIKRYSICWKCGRFNCSTYHQSFKSSCFWGLHPQTPAKPWLTVCLLLNFTNYYPCSMLSIKLNLISYWAGPGLRTLQ